MIVDTLSREFTLRHAGPSDAARLAAFAARTFADTFGEHNTAEDMALYLGGTYGAAKQGEEIADPEWATILAEHQGQVAGFAQLRRGPVPVGVSGRAPLELLRFYVDRPWHGRGLARALMHAVEAEARTRGADALWLAVWEHNDRARVFYRKAGFAEVGSKEFVLGTDRQTDRVMAKPLPALERQT
jgi:diamine N-acetyltransferase